MAYWLKTDGSIEEVTFNPKDRVGTLARLQEYVGGYIEVAVTHTGDLMVVNEEGKLHGLPYNLLATERYRFGGYDPIVGNAIICRREEIETDEEEE